MGDKPSVEARNFQSDVDDYNPCHSVPENPQDVHTAVDIASTSRTDHLLTNFHDTSGVLPPIQSDAVNGLRHHSPDRPPLSTCIVSSPKRKMKQSKSAHHNVNGDSTVVACQDAKRSLSVDAKLTDADGREASSSAVDNCVASGKLIEAAAADNSSVQPVESPSPSTSSTVTVLSVVHADNEGRNQKPGH